MGKPRRARRGQSETSSRPIAAAAPAATARYAVVLALAGAAVYWNAASAPFTFDDQVSVVTNTQIRRLWPLWDALSPPAGGWPVSGRPLVNLSLAVNYALGGLDVRGYHLVNIALHVLCAWLLFGVIRRTLESRALRDRFAGAASGIAFVGALIWMLHPLQTETIDYISKRSELLMSLSYLLTLYASIRAIDASNRAIWLTLSVMACAAGMACKESMVTAPLIVVLYDVTFVFESFREALRRRAGFYGALLSTWAILGLLIWSGPRGFTAGFTSRLTAWTYLLNQSKMIARYLQLTMWPHGLVLDYGEPVPMTLGAAAPYAALILVLIVLTAIALQRGPKWGFLGAWFFVILAPTSSIIPIATEAGAESRMYLPLAAIVIAIVVAGYLCLKSRTTAVVAVAVVCVALTAVTLIRNQEYQSPVALWRTVVERWPHARAHRDLADAWRQAGHVEEAVAELREAAREQPDARYALGQVLFDQGRMQDALVELRQAIDESPADPDAAPARDLIVAAQGKLANEKFSQGDFTGAAAAYESVLKLRPENASAWQFLGVALIRTGRTAEAVRALQRAVDLNPADGQAQRNLASALLDAHDDGGAVLHATEAVRLNPGDAASHTVRGYALMRTQHLDDAIEEFRASLAIRPSNNDASRFLSDALASRNAAPKSRRPR